MKRKHPRQGEKKKQGGNAKVLASKPPKRGGPQGGKGKVPKPPSIIKFIYLIRFRRIRGGYFKT